MMNRRKNLSLKSRLLLISISVLIIAFGIIAAMFWQTARSLQNKTVESLNYIVQEISGNLDALTNHIQIMSDAFANDSDLLSYLDRDYAAITDPERRNIEKRLAIANIRNNVFDGYNRLQSINQISAIYNIRTGQLFNFLQPDKPEEDAAARLFALGAADMNKLSRCYWYPLQEHFLTGPTGDPRQDAAVIGSRRIYSRQWIDYSYIHIFAMPEQMLYDCYAKRAESLGGEVYILDTEGSLLSSSSLEAVKNSAAPEALRQVVLTRKASHFEWTDEKGVVNYVSVFQSNPSPGQSGFGGWITVLLVPKSYATRELQGLYRAIVLVMLLGILSCILMIFYLYRQFMNPISDLGEAMKKVDHGDLNAYLRTSYFGREAGQMIHIYNQMLESINRSIEEKLTFEQTKKDLDMQVLTSQINPHFLYNTLETVVWKAVDAKRPDIGKIAAALGKLYRLSVNNGAMFFSLSQELEYLKHYLEIQKSRFEGQFDFAYDIDERLLDCQVPKIILQPIVENVFLYAVPESAKKISVLLSIRQYGNFIRIRVADDGHGIGKERLKEVRRQIETGTAPKSAFSAERRQGAGIGLHNINARLELYMGIRHALRLSSKSGFGTIVSVWLPQSFHDKNRL